MWVTPYKYNGDRNAMPLEHLRVVVERDKSEYDYICYVWGEELDISCTANDPNEVLENMLTALESFGFEGTVDVDGIEDKRRVELGKTEHFYTTFRHLTIGEE